MLVAVKPVESAFGLPVGPVFGVIEGDQAETLLMESATLAGKSSLSELAAVMGE